MRGRPENPHTAGSPHAGAQELSLLLEAPAEALLGWLEALVERTVTAPSGGAPAAPLARHFLVVWGAAGAAAERQLASAASPPLRLLRLLLDEWVRLLLERLLADALVRQLLANVASDAPPDLTGWHG